jgi:hypothetical protein
LREIVEAVIADRFLEALDTHTEQVTAGVYHPEYDADEYLVAAEELDETAESGDSESGPVVEQSAGENDQ